MKVPALTTIMAGTFLLRSLFWRNDDEQSRKQTPRSGTGAGALPFAPLVPAYADEAMHWMVMISVLNGMGDGRLAPGETADRAQIAAIFQRFTAALAES